MLLTVGIATLQVRSQVPLRRPPGDEQLTFEWTRAPWTYSDDRFEILIKKLRALRSSDKSREFLHKNATVLDVTKPDPYAVFGYAYVAFTESQAGHETEITMTALRRLFQRASFTPSLEFSRLRYLVETQVERRPEMISQYIPLAKRLLLKRPKDFAVRFYSADFFWKSLTTTCLAYSSKLSRDLALEYPDSLNVAYASANVLLGRWYVTKNQDTLMQAIRAFEFVGNLEKVQLSAVVPKTANILSLLRKQIRS